MPYGAVFIGQKQVKTSIWVWVQKSFFFETQSHKNCGGNWKKLKNYGHFYSIVERIFSKCFLCYFLHLIWFDFNLF